MAVNEFEKNVQKIMEEFRIHPSGDVWQNVEKRISEKKRKRRILFFIIFLGMGLMMGGYGINSFLVKENTVSQQANQKHSEKIQNKISKEQKTSGTEKIMTKNNTRHENTNQEIAVKKKSANEKIRVDQDHNSKKEIARRHFRNNNIAQVKGKDSKPFVSSTKNKEEEEKNISKDKKKNNIDQSISLGNDQPDSIDTGRQPIRANTQKNIAANNPADTVLRKINEIRTDNVVPGIKKISTHKKDMRKIKWGLNFSPGLSTITPDLLFLKPKTRSNSNSIAGPGTSAGGGSGFTNIQPGNRSSFAFKADLRVSKKLTKHSSLSIGIGYTYLSDRIKTGAKQTNNSQVNYLLNVSAYYGGNAQETFTDRFHFIELPIIYDWRITRNTNHFLSFYAGTSITYLISTNALIYDTVAGGVYYHNKNLFNRTGINLISGLSYHFTAKNFEFNIGPQLSSGLNKIIKSDLDKRKYILYSGVDATIFLKKRK
ncbi:MAG: porin family protein [Chitinophagales bacterium]